MSPERGPRGGWREAVLVVAGASLLAIALTWPLATRMGTVGRVDNGDGQFSIWNVAWVARTLVVDPLHVFDANIFYPHTDTLAYSENNLGAGVLAIPVYWLTKNPYAALNSAMLLGFILSAAGAYYLVRYLTRDRRAAIIAGVMFGFCPWMFSHTAHIQLLMTAGLPFVMLAFHRLTDRPTPGRGAALGAVMAAQAIACGYYGVFAILMVGFAFVIVATVRRQWTDAKLWSSIATAAVVSILLVAPAFLPYVTLNRVEGFRRDLTAAASFSGNWSDYLASAAYAHAWMLPHLPRWTEVSFPGFVAIAFGVLGAVALWRDRRVEPLGIYGGFAVLAFWASLGPRAGFYSAMYRVIPLFAWLRAPARFGLIFVLSAAVLAGFGLAAFFRRRTRAALAAAILAAVTIAELAAPMTLPDVPPIEPVYKALARLPRGAVIEMPFFYPEVGLFQHERYMLASTAHWMPLVNGYSDYIPPDFSDHVILLSSFPSRDSFKILEPNHVRYALFHMYGYNTEARGAVEERMKQFASYLRPLYADASGARLYEIVGFPP